MKSVFLGMILVVVISLSAWFVMDNFAQSSDQAFVSPNNSVRLTTQK